MFRHIAPAEKPNNRGQTTFSRFLQKTWSVPYLSDGEELQPKDYVTEAEKFGVPQTRYRVILFGIRSDLAASAANFLRQPGRFVLKAIDGKVNVKQALAGMPALRSRLSKEPDSQEAWLSRRHMRSDLHRYMFVSCFAAMQKYSPNATRSTWRAC